MADEIEVPAPDQSDLDILADEPEVETEPKVEETETAEEEPTEEKPEVPVEEAKTEESTEEIPPSRYPRPSLKEIRGKYPNFFKDFPEIKNAMFREQAYTEVFPTVEDATEAREAAETFNWVQEDLLQGNPGRLIQALAQTDRLAARKFVDNFIPSLQRINEDLYFQTITPLVQNFVRAMYADGKRSGNENLANSALHALQFAGFEPEILTGQARQRSANIPPELVERVRESEASMQQMVAQRFQEVAAGVEYGTRQELDSLILDSIKDDKTSDFVKQSMTEKMVQKLDAALASDEKHMGLMASLWKRAERAGFSAEWAERIRSAYISRAKAVLPAIRNEVRNQALGSQAAPKAAPIPENRPANQRSVRGNVEKIPTKRIDWSNTSDLDILEDKVTLRRS